MFLQIEEFAGVRQEVAAHRVLGIGRRLIAGRRQHVVRARMRYPDSRRPAPARRPLATVARLLAEHGSPATAAGAAIMDAATPPRTKSVTIGFILRSCWKCHRRAGSCR